MLLGQTPVMGSIRCVAVARSTTVEVAAEACTVAMLVTVAGAAKSCHASCCNRCDWLQELLLQSQLIEIAEKLAVASCEAEYLRSEREELQYQIRYLYDTLAVKAGTSTSQQP